MDEQTQFLSSYLEDIKRIRENKGKEEEKFSANIIVGRLAFFYEKMRNTLEYRDEHLIFKGSLERILKRKFPSYTRGSELAKEIMSELIAGGYIDNGSVPTSVVQEIDILIMRYYDLSSLLGDKIKKDIISFLACAIEEKLKKEVLEEEALVRFAFSDIERRTQVDVVISPDLFNQELYISLHRNLIKSDYQTIRYRFIRLAVPDMENNLVDIQSVSSQIEQRNNEFDTLLKSSRKQAMLKFTRKVSPAYAVIGKIISDTDAESLDSLFLDKEALRHKIDLTYSKWRDRAYERIQRGAIRSVLFIFVTKMTLAFILELPYEIFVLDRINYLALGFNLMFPPLYMFLSTFTIRVPGKENLAALQSVIQKIVFNEEEQYTAKIKSSGSVKKTFFFLIYLLTFALSFGLLSWGLVTLQFSIVAGILFFIFFSTVSFFAYRIARISKELTAVRIKGKIIDVVIDFFSIPFIKMGQFLSTSFSRFNIFLFFFDFIIETPFKTLIRFIDEWVGYARDKKDDILNE